MNSRHPSGPDALETPVLGPEGVLVIHPNPSVRAALISKLREVSERPLSVYETDTVADGLGRLEGLDPSKVFLDLSHDIELALEALAVMRGKGRTVLGLYDPLLRDTGDRDLFRRAVRAGADDFLALPVSGEELFDALRANSEHQKWVEEPGRILTFFGAKGGVGTTTVAANLALVLSGGGDFKDVALCDASLQFGTAASVLGLEAERDLGDLVRDLGREDALTTYLATHPVTGLRVLARPRSIEDAEAVGSEDLSRVLLALRSRYQYVVVDTSSALDQVTLAALDLADHVFVVLEGLTPAVKATADALKVLGRLGFDEDRVSLILNRSGSFDGALGRRTVELELGGGLFAELPQNKDVVRAANNGAPLVISKQKNPFAVAVGDLADQVIAKVPSRRREMR